MYANTWTVCTGRLNERFGLWFCLVSPLADNSEITSDTTGQVIYFTVVYIEKSVESSICAVQMHGYLVRDTEPSTVLIERRTKKRKREKYKKKEEKNKRRGVRSPAAIFLKKGCSKTEHGPVCFLSLSLASCSKETKKKGGGYPVLIPLYSAPFSQYPSHQTTPQVSWLPLEYHLVNMHKGPNTIFLTIILTAVCTLIVVRFSPLNKHLPSSPVSPSIRYSTETIRVEVPVQVPVNVTVPVPVPVPVEVKVPVEVPIPVEVPVEVKVPVEVPIPVEVPVNVTVPVPVKVPVYKDKEPLCRQHRACGMEDMQLAYEGHYFGLQQCYAWSDRNQTNVPPRVVYDGLNENDFAPLLAAYETLEDLLQECLGEMEDVNQMERVLKVLHYPLPPMKIPKDLGEYAMYLSGGNVPGRAKKFVHTTAQTTCVGTYHLQVGTWREVDPDQRVVFWTDDALNRLVRRLFKHSKLHVFMRRVRQVNGKHQGVMIADLFRSFLMLVFGGVYADTDVKTTRPWEHIFDKYDVLAVHEHAAPNTTQWIEQNWRPGMRTVYGGSFSMMAHKPGLSYWVNYVNQAIDEMNRKSNNELGNCHPVHCTGPKMTTDRHYEFMASYPPHETSRATMLDEISEWNDYTGMKHMLHCSWCHYGKEPTFDVRAALPSPALIFPPGTLSERECPYEIGMKAIFDGDLGERNEPAVMEMDEELKKRDSQYPMFKLSGRFPETEAPPPPPPTPEPEAPAPPPAQPEEKPEEKEATPPTEPAQEAKPEEKEATPPKEPENEATPPTEPAREMKPEEKEPTPPTPPTPPAQPEMKPEEKEATPPTEPAQEAKPDQLSPAK